MEVVHFLCTPSRRVYIFNVHSQFFISACFISKQALMLKPVETQTNFSNLWFLGIQIIPLMDQF